MNSITEQVTAALNKLGPDAATMAATLANKGVRGQRGTTSQCVLTVYLSEQFPDCTFDTGRFHVHIISHSGVDCVYFTTEQLMFVERFDDGHYPDLVLDP